MTRTFITLAALLVLSLTVAVAEVAVVQVDQRAVAYIQRPIIDDPEPVGISWSPFHPAASYRVVLNADGDANADGRPALVTGIDLTPIVAWARNSPNGYDVVVSHFAEGAWSEPVVVADGPGDQLDPSLAVDAVDGTIHLVWWVDDGSPRVMHSEAPSDLSAWSVPDVVSSPGGTALRPSVVVHEGVLQIAYELHNQGQGTTPRQLMLATRMYGGYSMSWLAVTNHEPANWPQVHSGRSRLWVDWIDATGEMTWIEGDMTGGWSPIGIEPFEGPEERDFRVRRKIRRLVLD